MAALACFFIGCAFGALALSWAWTQQFNDRTKKIAFIRGVVDGFRATATDDALHETGLCLCRCAQCPKCGWSGLPEDDDR